MNGGIEQKRAIEIESRCRKKCRQMQSSLELLKDLFAALNNCSNFFTYTSTIVSRDELFSRAAWAIRVNARQAPFNSRGSHVILTELSAISSPESSCSWCLPLSLFYYTLSSNVYWYCKRERVCENIFASTIGKINFSFIGIFFSNFFLCFRRWILCRISLNSSKHQIKSTQIHPRSREFLLH